MPFEQAVVNIDELVKNFSDTNLRYSFFNSNYGHHINVAEQNGSVSFTFGTIELTEFKKLLGQQTDAEIKTENNSDEKK
jgi:hypothetical protein